MMIFRETFFRPPELRRESLTLSATLYHRIHRLLKTAHQQTKSVFVPIRTMQYLAIVDAEEVAFVDAEGGYKYQQGNLGGRIIELSWRHFHPQSRASIADPVPYVVIYYLDRAEHTMKQIFSEFSKALEQLEHSHQSSQPILKEAHILPFRR